MSAREDFHFTNEAKKLRGDLVNNISKKVGNEKHIQKSHLYYIFEHFLEEEDYKGDFKPSDKMKQLTFGFKTLEGAKAHLDYLEKEDLLPNDRENVVIMKVVK